MPPHLQNGRSRIAKRTVTNAQLLTSPRSDRAKLHGNNLRVAYNAQTTTDTNMFESNNNISNDHLSISGASAANSAATPSSVYMPSSVALSRDNMSDLSGVSGGTNRGSSSQAVPGQILDPKSLLRPWKQAYSLSNIPPECNKGEEGPTSSSSRSNDNKNNISPSIWVAQNDVVEIFDNLESSLGLDRFRVRKHDRIPIMVLLMDPSKQNYELMQIWVDPAIDSIRDLVQVLQHKLPSQWKQAYDGLFQVRGNRFTQLINIIKLVKYDIQPNEILIAKPWSMAAKVTIAIAGSAIRHLTRIGVIETDNTDGGKVKHRKNRKQQQPRNEDAPLLLSKRAQDRTYFPEGILDHHHATQFITLSPPFESSSDDNETAQNAIDPVTPTGFSPLHHNSSKKSSSNSRGHDAHSSLLGSNTRNSNKNNDIGIGKKSPGLLSLGIRRVIAGPRSRRNSTPTLPKRGHGRNSSSNNSNGIDSNREDIQVLVASSDDPDTNATTEPIFRRQQQQQQPHYYSDTITTCGPVGCFSKLNCLRNPARETTRKTDIGPEPTPHASMATLSEEEEKRWLAYSMKPIDEEQSLAKSSVVSMSAPLLSPTL